MQDIDYKILDLLQQNARATQSELAAAVGLSQPAVAERIRKLEKEGLITGYFARVNARKLGKDITAFIGVGIEHPKFNAGFASKILALPDVLECHHVTGQDSYLLKVVTENTESLDRLISERIRTIPGVTRTLTAIVMSTVKESSHIQPFVEEDRPVKKRKRRSS
ncbi:MAG TPA: Lrp/AsnC family transcriptional regulator [Blastocatellia bacterium]|nr:Lrp/AsnC family transcriptional regulator [Blastocatellia bacterium]